LAVVTTLTAGVLRSRSCRHINFDLINFADFYEDLMNNQKIPDASTMAQLAKDRVAAQVNQMGGK
jgi:conjugal transfer mating pair stabilization protein TraN